MSLYQFVNLSFYELANYELDYDNTYRAAFLDCEDDCIIAEKAAYIKGFFDGRVDAETGELVAEGESYIDYEGNFQQINDITPRLINRGIGDEIGELGDYLGDSDIGQVRYLNKPFDMWELLGFPCDNYYLDEDEVINLVDYDHRYTEPNVLETSGNYFLVNIDYFRGYEDKIKSLYTYI